MCFEFLSNPTIIGTISGAIIGAVCTTAFALITEKYRFNKRKKGAYALIKSEITYYVELLECFKDKYLKDEIKIDNNKINNEIYRFYYIMDDFPILNGENWTKLVDFIPDIFNPNDINEINIFYRKCNELSDDASYISKEEPYDIIGILNSDETPRRYLSSPDTINSHRNIFRNKLIELIEKGHEIEKIFK